MSKISTILLLIISMVLVVLFTYTAVSKMVDFESFRYDMLNQPLPKVVNHLMVWTIPTVELVAVILLLIQKTRIYGLYLSFVLLLAFTSYVGLILMNVFGRVPCSCGGILESLSWGEHLVVNVIFLVVTGVGVWTEGRAESVVQWTGDSGQ